MLTAPSLLDFMEAVMVPATGSPDWKRLALRAEADRLMASARYHRDPTAPRLFPTTPEADEACAQKCEYVAGALYTLAKAIWPPERGMDLDAVLKEMGDPPL